MITEYKYSLNISFLAVKVKGHKLQVRHDVTVTLKSKVKIKLEITVKINRDVI